MTADKEVTKQTGTVSVHVIESPPMDKLDAITVFFQDFDLGRGKVTLECYGSAWSCFFGAMGGNTIREFFLSCGSDYLVNKLGNSEVLKQTKRFEKYLERVIKAAQIGLRGEHHV